MKTIRYSKNTPKLAKDKQLFENTNGLIYKDCLMLAS